MDVKRRQRELTNKILGSDETFEEFVKLILDTERFEERTAAEGIAKKIVSEGSHSLSTLQLETFVQFGLLNSHNYVSNCERCTEEIPWSEMYEALDDSYCSYCRHMLNKY